MVDEFKRGFGYDRPCADGYYTGQEQQETTKEEGCGYTDEEGFRSVRGEVDSGVVQIVDVNEQDDGSDNHLGQFE